MSHPESEDVASSVSSAPLGRRVDGIDGKDPDAVLEAFLEYVADIGLELYPAQEEAVLEIVSDNHVILNTPTGSGKSLVGLAMHFMAMCRGKVSVYTSPIKALVSEKFFALCDVLGAENVGMLTGDASINPGAPVICCTAEILANWALRDWDLTDVDYAVVDEFHYYSDRDRGMAWQIPLLALANTTFLLMSATLGDMREIEESLAGLTGRDVSLVFSDERPVPLDYEFCNETVIEAVHRLVEGAKAPVYVVGFTQRECAETAQSLTSINLCTKQQKRALLDAMKGFSFDSPYGKDVRRFVSAGIGVHHAGLLPKYRLLVERLAQAGLLKVICGTDTLGVGINIPLRTVLFTKLCKFDGQNTRILSVRDFKQISGRAGRKGFDDQGSVVALAPEHVVANKRSESKALSTGKKKYKKAQPPKRGFVPWNEGTFKKLVANPPERLESVFAVTHGMMLNLLEREPTQPHGGYRRIVQLIARSHETAGAQSHRRRAAAALFRALREVGIVKVGHDQHLGRNAVWVSPDLQLEFSLNHSLSLYLIDALERIDPALETYPLDVMTQVESILENPRVILFAQRGWARGQIIAQLKAEGVPYEDRMDAIEDVTHPKPMEDFIYDTFNAFRQRRPWLVEDLIRPKSIARDQYERYCSFGEYVREYGLQRSEGVLLRYLTQAYKTLLQNVPESFRNDDLEALIAFLRATLERVDSSLVQAWEEMLHQSEADALELPTGGERRWDITKDRRSFFARIRAELHSLVRALSFRDFEEALRCLRSTETDEVVWTTKLLESELEPFFETYGKLRFDHEARLTDKTVIIEIGPREWEVTQILVDPEGDNLWGLIGYVDMRGLNNLEGPLVRLDVVRS